jgi:hypothetical protein
MLFAVRLHVKAVGSFAGRAWSSVLSDRNPVQNCIGTCQVIHSDGHHPSFLMNNFLVDFLLTAVTEHPKGGVQ